MRLGLRHCFHGRIIAFSNFASYLVLLFESEHQLDPFDQSVRNCNPKNLRIQFLEKWIWVFEDI